MRAAEEVAVGVGGEQGHVVDVGIVELDAEELRGAGLQVGPGRHGGDGLALRVEQGLAVRVERMVAQQRAGRGDQALVADHVLAQEDLVRGMRRVALALVDEGGDGVGAGVDVVRRAEHAIGAGQVGGAGQHHEVGVATRDVERVVRHQRDEDRAVAALGDQVDAMVEELAEEGQQAAERRREPGIRRHVVDEEALLQAGDRRAAARQVGRRGEIAACDVVRGAEDAVGTRLGGVQVAVAELAVGLVEGGDGRGIVEGLVGDEVADDARLRVHHQAARLRVAGAVLRILQQGIADRRKGLVGGAIAGLPRHQTIVGAVHGPETK